MISSWVFCGWPASCFSSWVLLTTSASCSRTLATCCRSGPESTVLEWAMLVKLTDSTASKMAPANARPNDRPNDPPAEFTPAASLTRSSETGASWYLFSGETSRPSPAPAIINGTTRYQPEVARGTIGSTTTIPMVNSANPARMRLAGRRFPPLLPASRATANMLRGVGRDEPSEQRADGGGDRGRGSDQRISLPLRRALKVAVDE